MKDSCEMCKFFEPNEPSDGECRRHAPAVVTQDINDKISRRLAVWPVVEIVDWCGEFEPGRD